MPRAAISVATSTRTAPDLKSFNARNRWFCDRFECNVAVRIPACSNCRARRSAPCFMSENTSTMFICGSRSKCSNNDVFRCFGTSYTNCVTVSAGFERRPICTVFGDR